MNKPFIVPLKFSFQSEQKLDLMLASVNGRELFHRLQREQQFNEVLSHFYSTELLLALEHLHKLDVVYQFVCCRVARNFFSNTKRPSVT